MYKEYILQLINGCVIEFIIAFFGIYNENVIESPDLEDLYSYSDLTLLKALSSHFSQCPFLRKKYPSIEILCRNKQYLKVSNDSRTLCLLTKDLDLIYFTIDKQFSIFALNEEILSDLNVCAVAFLHNKIIIGGILLIHIL